MSSSAGKLSRIPRADQWADRICTQLGKTVESILEVGRLLVSAKAALPHGEFGRMFKEGLVPFGQSTADKLIAIAKHPVLSNSDHGPNLPPSWRTLYELTKADGAKLRAALKNEVIRPDMKRRDIQALLPPKRHASRRHAPTPAATDVTEYRTASGRVYFQIAHMLSDEFDALSPEDQDDLLTMLDQMLAELRANRLEKMVTA
ncbi:MAG TPA: DUF3102 domain-containing protein [Burkholderiales bacterium]|nr:DUF3102 domain-containing protein [Burkholderiales bacterium]